MTEVVLGGAPAGNSSETATPAAAQPNAATTQSQTDGDAGGEVESGTSKTFTQQELDEIVKRRVAKAEDRAERRVLRTLEKLQPQQSAPRQESPQDQKDEKPTPRQGETTDAYLDRLTDWKLEQRDRKAAGERQQEQNRTMAQKTRGVLDEAAKLPGFDLDAFAELPISDAMTDAILESEVGARLVHHLAANPEEALRIAKLTPARQAAELGKLEATLPAVRKSSKAPDPSGNPAAGAGNTSVVSGDLGKLPMDKYQEQRAKQGARWAQR